MKYKYKYVLLKMSGESLMDKGSVSYDYNKIHSVIMDIKSIMEDGIKLSIVIGGGNIVRGADLIKFGLERTVCDSVGMLSTIMNAIVLQNMMLQYNINCRVLTPMPVMNLCEQYIISKARYYTDQGEVVILAGGLGIPFFTTDSAAVLRALELNCDIMLKGTKVDGVYDKDPVIHLDAKKFNNITYDNILLNKLNIMDITAIELSKQYNLPIIVFSILDRFSIKRVLQGNSTCTIINSGD